MVDEKADVEERSKNGVNGNASQLHGKIYEEVGYPKADHEDVRKMRQELKRLKGALEDGEIRKIRKELDALKAVHRDTVEAFNIQRAQGAILNKIQQVIVPILTALVVALASWVWNSQGKLEGTQIQVATVSASINEIKEDLQKGTANRYTRADAQHDHSELEDHIFKAIQFLHDRAPVVAGKLVR